MHASKDQLTQLMTLEGIINNFKTSKGDQPRIQAVVSAILGPHCAGKVLDLMFWKLDDTGTRTVVPGFVGGSLNLPSDHGHGPFVGPYPITLPPIHESGIYGFELFDRDGIFGEKESLLATYVFGIAVD